MDPVNIGVRLLIRTMSNFQGSLILIERGMEVEALTLVRNRYENGFWIGAFFTIRLRLWMLSSWTKQKVRIPADAFVRIAETHGDPTMRAKTRQQFANRRANSKPPIGLEKLAQLADLHPNYAFYKDVSAGSAHPSLNSLDRYLDRNADGDWGGFVVGPSSAEAIGTTLNLACHALISGLAGFGHLIGRSEDDQRLFDLNERYKSLAGIKHGS